MRDKDEYIPADPTVRKTWLIVFLIYILLLLWLEPIIDWSLSSAFSVADASTIESLNRQKVYITAIVFGVARSLPIIYFLWIGYRIMITSRVPPPGIRLPIAVKVTKGQKAKTQGMVVLGVALLLLFREFTVMASA